MEKGNYSDHELLVKLSEGDSVAFGTLFGRYWDKVYSTALVILKSADRAEDFVQEVFLILWRERAKAAEIRHLENFLFITTRNLIYNRLKRMKTEEAYQHFLRLSLREKTQDATEMTNAESRDLKHLLDIGVRQLPHQQQRAFLLSRELGYSHEQIAAEMNISRDTVKDYIVKALAFLRKYLKENADFLIVIPGIYFFC